MDEKALIAVRLEQTFTVPEAYGPSINEGSFHGPSLMETLDGVDHRSSRRRPVPGRHCIWEIVNHCSFWMKAAADALSGHSIPDVDDAEDWPEIGETQTEWERDTRALRSSFEVLHDAVEAMDGDRLDEITGSRFHGAEFRFTFRKLLHGVCDHNVYHAGQISLLRPLKG